MKTWTETLALAALATLFTLPLAGCAEDAPGSMTEAEPETFDAANVYEIVPVGGTPSLPGDLHELSPFLQFDSEESKRRISKDVEPQRLVSLSAEHTAQIETDMRRVMFRVDR